MKFASPLGDIQQAGAPETVAKSVTPCFTFGWWLQALRYKFAFHYHQLAHGAYTSCKCQIWHEFSNIYNAICTQARNWSASLENVSTLPLWKMCWTYFETIGHSLKHLSSSQKTLRPPGVPSWLWACIHNNERRKERGRKGALENYDIFLSNF